VGPLRNSTGELVDNDGEMAGLLNRFFFASTYTQDQSGELPIAESTYLGDEQELL